MLAGKHKEQAAITEIQFAMPSHKLSTAMDKVHLLPKKLSEFLWLACHVCKNNSCFIYTDLLPFAAHCMICI